jgi:hypothetical protein
VVHFEGLGPPVEQPDEVVAARHDGASAAEDLQHVLAEAP